jgi:peptidoglycan/LPS O-acetylase OafA/YrhL
MYGRMRECLNFGCVCWLWGSAGDDALRWSRYLARPLHPGSRTAACPFADVFRGTLDRAIDARLALRVSFYEWRQWRDRFLCGLGLPYYIYIAASFWIARKNARCNFLSCPVCSHWMGSIGRTGVGSTVLALGTCCVMFGSVLSGRRGTPWSEPIRWVGRCSYEIYLTHEFVVVWLTLLYLKLQRGPVLIWIAAMVMLSVVVGAWVARGFSEPMNRRLRDARIPSNHAEHAEQMV